jgi:manganese efflux pump family protein
MARFKQLGATRRPVEDHGPVVKLVLFVLPLGLDTFAVSAALGLAGLPKRERLKVSLLFSAFEMAMPVVGLLLGHALGHALGGVADYVAAATLLGVGAWMLFGEEDDEGRKVSALVGNSGVALFALGVSISLDELAMGFTIGLLHLSIVLAVVLIGVQAFVFAQIGLRLGSRLGETAREWAEKIAGLALIGLALLVLVETL